jgi:hypothetical protein
MHDFILLFHIYLITRAIYKLKPNQGSFIYMKLGYSILDICRNLLNMDKTRINFYRDCSKSITPVKQNSTTIFLCDFVKPRHRRVHTSLNNPTAIHIIT